MAVTRTEHALTGVGGLRLVYDVWTPPRAARAVVLLAHGLAEHARRYDHVAERFGDAGLLTYALDHRGHGRSGGARVIVRDIAEYRGDLAALADRAAADHPDLPRVVVGHSMGGAIALAYAAEHPDDIVGLVLSGPAVATRDEVSAPVAALGTLLGRVLPGLPVEALDVEAVSRDPQVVAAYRDDPLVHRGKVPAGVARVLFTVARRRRTMVAALTAPLLVVQGGADRLTPPAGARALVGEAVAAGLDDVTFVCWPQLFHEVFNEPERDVVLDRVTEWIDGVLRPAPR